MHRTWLSVSVLVICGCGLPSAGSVSFDDVRVGMDGPSREDRPQRSDTPVLPTDVQQQDQGADSPAPDLVAMTDLASDTPAPPPDLPTPPMDLAMGIDLGFVGFDQGSRDLGGGDGSCVTCLVALDTLMLGNPPLPPENVCAGASRQAYALVLSCACNQCPDSDECQSTLCRNQAPDAQCLDCINDKSQGCPSEISVCKGN